jgi:hypothetical protein
LGEKFYTEWAEIETDGIDRLRKFTLASDPRKYLKIPEFTEG